MLTYDPKRTVKWPVTVRVPQDGGGIDKVEVTVEYELLTAEDAAGDAETLLAKVRGWEGIADVNGNEITYSQDNLKALLGVPYIARAFGIGLVQASAGAPGKNL